MRKPLVGDELRAHPRIAAPARAVVFQEGRAPTELPVRDLSRGGLFLFTPPDLFDVGEPLTVELATVDGGVQVVLPARVVREQLVPKSETGFGLRFEDVTPRQDARLRELLKALMDGPGGKRRAFPRVSHRVTVQCAGSKRATALLRDLSLGGAGLWLDTPLAMEEQVVLHLTAAGFADLALPARVVSTRWAMDEQPYDQAGVEFVELDEPTQGALRAYLLRLIDA